MQVKMNSMIGSRGILYDELARAGSSQSCYICGADHATWTIYSKCMADNRPFFPFLEYHKPSKEVKKLGKGGRTLACNLCYSLLIQQWNAYEANGTPVLKRLYWLKRTSGGESGTIEGYGSDCSSPDKFSVRHDFSDSDDQGGTAGSESGRFSAHSIRGADSESVADTGDTKDLHFRARASPAGQDTEERMDRPGVVFVPDPYGKLDQGVPGECCCFVCGRMKAKEFMRSVHSRPQLKPETPFYPCLAQYRQPPNAKPMDFQGKVLVCEACQKFLFQQWQVFQRNGTPASERQYQLRSDPSFPKDQQSEFATMVCFLCRTIQPATSGRFIHSQKHTLGDPFYPFLKNLPLPPGAMPLTREGLTCACSSCRKSLYQQWKTFEAARIPDEDRVYANLMDKTIGSAFQPSINPLPPDHEILCFICQTRDYRQNMKELHASPYANMCLSFLEKIEKFPGTVYLRDSLQALVCKFCYHSIRDQWETFEAKHIPLDKRQYRLHSTVPVAYTKTSTLMAIMSTGDYEASHCDLCEVELPTTELQDLLIAPTCLAGKEKTVPYFPFLSRWKTYNEGENASSKKILVCKLCAANLVAQWNRYERMMDCSDNERWNRRYKVHHFICYRCGDTVHRTNVKVLDRRRYSSLLTQQPPRDAIELKNLVVICWECKEKLDTEGREMQILSKRDVARRSERHMSGESVEVGVLQHTSKVIESLQKDAEKESDSERCTTSSSSQLVSTGDSIGMRVTATVPPLPNNMMSSQAQERGTVQSQGNSARNDDEGSFAAALRKLAQQAIVPVGRGHSSRDRQSSPSVGTPKSAFHGHPGRPGHDARRSPPSHSHIGQHTHQVPIYSRPGGHLGNAASVMASVMHPVTIGDIEKSDLSSKGGYGGPRSPAREGSPGRLQPRQILPGIFTRPGSKGEHSRHQSDESGPREPQDRNARGLDTSMPSGPLSAHSIKDRSSNVGLVHPQPVRKLPEEDPSKAGRMGAVRCASREAGSNLFRPPSPSETFSRYGPLPAGLHQHNSQTPCPVHGHEPGHRHGSPGDHSSRPPTLAFDHLGAPGGSNIPELRALHTHHQRLREDLYNAHRHSIERREPLPHPLLEEEYRRRGYEWPWNPMQHHLYDNEQYRRHFINGLRGHDHPFKDLPHSQPYYHPTPYYGRDYPLPVDPYGHPALSHADAFPHRHGPPLSPRLLEYYRREHKFPERSREHVDPRRLELRSERIEHREHENSRERISEDRGERPRDDSFIKRLEERGILSTVKEETRRTPTACAAGEHSSERHEAMPVIMIRPKREEDIQPPKKMQLVEDLTMIQKDVEADSSPLTEASERRECNEPRIFLTEKANASREEFTVLDHDVNGRGTVSESPCSDDTEFSEPSLQAEDNDVKMDFMASLGLIPHGKRRALEEDYERKRWERKFRKMRGRPKKRTKREQTEESEGRPSSDLDFYNGPMTRHKQQLLQEQEMLLEQLSQRVEDRDEVKESEKMNIDNEPQKTSSPVIKDSSDSSSSPFLLPTSTAPSEKPRQPLTVDTYTTEESNKVSRVQHSRPPSENHRLLTFYKDKSPRETYDHHHSVAGVKRYRNQYEASEGQVTRREDPGYRTVDRYLFGRLQTEDPQETSASKFRWSGIEEVARAYISYKSEQETEENHLRRTFERLKATEESVSQITLRHRKDMVALREKQLKLSEDRRKLQRSAEGLHQALRAMAKL